MDNFFKQFKENLDNRPEPEFEEKFWQRLEFDLKQGNTAQKKGFAWWWATLGILLFSSIGSNLLFFNELQKSNARFSTLINKTDTIFQTQIIYKTDTIFEPKTIQEKSVKPYSNFFGNSPFLSKNFPTWTSKFVTNLFNYKKSSIFGKNLQNMVIQNLSILPENKLEENHTNQRDLSQLASKNFVYFNLPHKSLKLFNAEPDLNSERSSFKQHLYKLRPKGFRLGINGGWAQPLEGNFIDKTGFSIDFEADIEFSNSLQMWANVAWQSLSFDSKRMGEDIGIPEIAPPTDDFNFVKAEVPQRGMQYSLGMQYFFNSDKNWHPFFGAGYGAVNLLPYEVTYEFKNETTDFEWNFEESVNRQALITDFLLFRAGLEYKISNNWHWRLALGYRINLNKNGIQSPRLLNLKMGLNYKF